MDEWLPVSGNLGQHLEAQMNNLVKIGCYQHEATPIFTLERRLLPYNECGKSTRVFHKIHLFWTWTCPAFPTETKFLQLAYFITFIEAPSKIYGVCWQSVAWFWIWSWQDSFFLHKFLCFAYHVVRGSKSSCTFLIVQLLGISIRANTFLVVISMFSFNCNYLTFITPLSGSNFFLSLEISLNFL